MAVYTELTKSDISEFLNSYKIGDLITFEGIIEGVENSNFKLNTSKNNFILTVFEKRVDSKDLPFFIKLMNHLYKKNIKCPCPIIDIDGNYIKEIKDKPSVIVSYVQGKWIKSIKNIHCEQLGQNLAKMHLASNDFKLSRYNSMGMNEWSSLFSNFNSERKSQYNEIYDIIKKELIFIKKEWPKDLPSGVIHADLFQDNVFFENDIFSGIIDFYFACNDFYAYELAVCLNAWCFERDQSFNITKARLILNNYQKERPLIKEEKEYFPILSRGAALRFLLTRLNDLIFHPKDAKVNPKNPVEYLKILQFHQKIKSISEYGLDN